MHDGSCMRCCYGVFLSSGAFTQVTLVSKQPSTAVFGNERIAYDCSRGWCVVGGRPARPQPLLLILESPKLEKGDLWSHNYKALTVWCNTAISSHSVRQKKKNTGSQTHLMLQEETWAGSCNSHVELVQNMSVMCMVSVCWVVKNVNHASLSDM